jgi:hypothetical protein
MLFLKRHILSYLILIITGACVFFWTPYAHARPDILQTPTSVQVDYAIQNNNLVLMLATRPPISGCGKISNLPVSARYDSNSIDLYLGPYVFTPAKYDVRGAACGPTYKISIARVSVPLIDLKSKDINRIRLWSDTKLDTFLITNDDSSPTLSQISGAGFFKLGNYLLQVPPSFNRLAGQTQ